MLSPNNHQLLTSHLALLVLVGALFMAASPARAHLVQPLNYLLDDSALLDQTDALSPYLADQVSSNEQSADKDIVGIIADGLSRLRAAKMLEQSETEAQMVGGVSGATSGAAEEPTGGVEGASLESMAAALSPSGELEAAVSAAPSSPASQQVRAASKADVMKVGPTQWFNPKETIPILKISSMATPSKYKKVYFRSEKKLVDGAFQPTGESDARHSAGAHSAPSEPIASSIGGAAGAPLSALVEQLSQRRRAARQQLIKPFNSALQRRSSRGTSSSVAPPGVLQDGVVEFIKKFRDVYAQTRPEGSSPTSGIASSVVSAAASSPLVSVLSAAPLFGASGRPSSSGGPMATLSALSGALSSLSAASGGVSSGSNSAASLVAGSAASSSSSGSGALSAGSTGGVAASAAATPSKSPLSAQTYVSFWSKTFPSWVRKMLKQMRRRSLQNSTKRHQQHAASQSASSTGVGQAAASLNDAPGSPSASSSSSSS